MIAYLISQYPAPSHTFIRREVAALRAAGLTIGTYSVRRPVSGGAGARDAEDAAATFVILAQSALAMARAHFAVLLRGPARYFGAFALALRHRAPGARALLWAVFHFIEAVVLADRLRRDRAVRLHNHFANAGATVGMLAARIADLPWSLTLHGISEFDYPAGLLLADKIERARFVACVSRFGMAQAMRLTAPTQWPKLHLVRCGIELAELPIPTSPAREGGPLSLICVGRLSSEKGHAGLLEAMALLRERGVPVHLTLVGDGPQQAALLAQIGTLGLEGQVTMTGRLDEAATLRAIGAADALVLPSFMEGLPVVLMEALALRKPVVAARVAGIPELVDEGVTGLLFTPADWPALASVIAMLAGDRTLGERLAAAGRQRVETSFAIERAVAPLLPLFEAHP